MTVASRRSLMPPSGHSVPAGWVDGRGRDQVRRARLSRTASGHGEHAAVSVDLPAHRRRHRGAVGCPRCPRWWLAGLPRALEPEQLGDCWPVAIGVATADAGTTRSCCCCPGSTFGRARSPRSGSTISTGAPAGSPSLARPTGSGGCRCRPSRRGDRAYVRRGRPVNRAVPQRVRPGRRPTVTSRIRYHMLSRNLR